MSGPTAQAQWQGMERPFAALTLPELFEGQVRRTPDAPALGCGEERLTYRELNARANRLARLLTERGVGPERIVAVLVPRSVELVVALVAVAKTGAAYLPMDTEYPADRVAFMLSDARPACLLTTAGAGAAVEGFAGQAVVLDAPEVVRALSGAAEGDLGDGERTAALRPAHPAYVIYTSGSTGVPKAVMIEHRALADYLGWSRQTYPSARGTSLWHSSVSFDMTVTSLWVPLAGGGRVLAGPLAEDAFGGAPECTFLKATPSHLPLLDVLPAGFSPTEELMLGGEALIGSVLDAWRRRHPAATVLNVYGPTEVTVNAAEFRLEPGEPTPDGVLPLGRLMDNARGYVLDAALRPVGEGDSGELYIAGPGLARGYLGRPGLTSERFVADPYGAPGSRMYRTGDLARWRADGQLEFLGRTDHQVKVRGHRVELGEIEAVLMRHPLVSRTVVLVREDRAGDQRIVAYVTGVGGAEAPGTAALRELVGASLPEYMVPSAVVVLEQWPLTPNGKVDRDRLPAPDYASHAESGGRAPRNATEESLTSLFAEVLGLPAVTIDDNFFHLGGHSLLVTRLISRVRATLHADLTVRALFEHPTVAELAPQLPGMPSTRSPLTPAGPRPSRLPLSPAQRRLWFAYQLEGPSPTYNIPHAFRIGGPLDHPTLAAALADLAERHETLRTRITEHDGEPRQTVLPADQARPGLPMVPTTEEQLPGHLAEQAAHAFDLARENPFRATLYRLGEEDHVLLLLSHHIAGDGWSTAPLLRDLGAAYTARRHGTAPTWQPLAVQYADYTLWHEEMLGSEDDPASLAGRQLDFWRGQLTGLPELLELPLDRPRPAVAGHRGASVRFALDAGLHQGVARLARQCDVTVFMVFQAAVAALLSRLGAGTDIPLGTAVAGRTDDALDDLVGFFVNTLVLRTDVSGDPTFRELLARVRETGLAAYAHQDVPFERVVEAVNPVRTLSHTPLFQTMLTSQNMPEHRSAAGAGLDAVPEDVPRRTARFDLSFHTWEQQAADGSWAGVDGLLEYATELFDEGTAEALAARLVRLLGAAVAGPDLPVGELELLTSGERDRLLHGWQGEPRALSGRTVPELFEERAAQSPDAVAVLHEDSALTYRELNERANRLARVLAARGVGPESYVAVALPRSVELVVALMAVLKAGGAYLPLDPSYPADRLGFMLADVAPVLVLTRSGMIEEVPAPCPLLRLDDPATAAEVAARSADGLTDADRSGPLSLDNAAFVIFTSGSTGRPKGVTVQHRSLDGYLSWTRSAYPGVAGTALVHSPVAFDLTATGLFAPLTSGGCVQLIELDASSTAGADRHSPSFVKATPSHLPLLIELPDAFSPDEQLVLGGESLMGEVLDEWRARHPGATVINEYGPTETTVGCSEYRIEPGDSVPAGVVTIGRPVWNTQMFVLDARLQPVPAGSPGEIYIAGDLVTRGYHRRPDLTATRFVANPFGPPGSRMYRSGDLGRWRADGQLEFIARVDDQVKIRGFRIELGEIEGVLGAHPELAQAAVIVREDRPGDKRLVGYAVPAPGCSPDPAELRRYAAGQLPDYMVPVAFVLLDELPLTVNRKLDRRALPVPDYGAARAPGRGPRTAHEEILSGAFAEVLGLPRVGVDDSFFALGGHSLLATRLIAGLRGALGVELSIRAVFETPTVAGLAARLDGAERARPALVAADRPERVPLSFAQRRLWFIHRLQGSSVTYNIPTWIRLTGPLDHDALRAAVGDLVARHEVLRTVYPEEAGEPYQQVLPAGALTPDVTFVRVAGEAELTEALAQAALHPFGLVGELPLQVSVFSLNEREHVLAVVMHHIASDGWSMAPLARDLSEAYGARLAGRGPVRDALPVQYADYALWQRELLGSQDAPGSVISQQLAFWERELAGAPELLELPLDRPRPAVAGHHGGSVRLELDPALHRQLVALAQGSGATLFMVLHAAIAALLSRLGAGRDIPVGTAVAGRTDEALDDLVGFFINTLVLRTDLSGDPTFRELLGRARKTDLAAYAHQDVPFERVVEAVNPDRALSHSPLVQVVTTLQSYQQGALDFPGTEATAPKVTNEIAKFDLIFFWEERQDADLVPDGIGLEVKYATDLFDHGTAVDIADRLLRVLRAAVADPDRRVGQIEILAPEERERLLSGWNDTARSAAAATLPALFEAQVAHAPDAPALVHGDRTYRYAELAERVNRLARLLVERGVGPERVVALALPKSAELIVAMLAVVTAGGAYLPVDPEYPAERIAYMLDDARPACLITLTDTSLPETECPRLFLDDPTVVADLNDRPTAPLAPRAELRHPAYVIYTSGSTGRPKGVEVTHAGVADLSAAARENYLLDGDSRVLQLSSPSFDASVIELVMALTTGAALVVPDGQPLAGEALAGVLREARISHTLIPPATLATLPDGELPDLRTLVTGADAVSVELAGRWATRYRMINSYGPTESTVAATMSRPLSGEGLPPIGVPVANTRVYVLDAGLRPVPAGIPGELYIAGHGLARGYRNRAALTAERFVANPYGTPGERMYRTGDLVRRRADGELEYVGRTDAQVKVRGFRIELGEIEAVLDAHPRVKQTMALVREDSPGDKRIVAYTELLPELSGPLPAEDLLEQISGSLPRHMVPSAVVVVERWPLLPNGKVDRKALPAPGRPAPSAEHQAPRTPREETLCGLFAELLGLPEVGIHDSFFRLGGHSLLATRLISGIRAALGAEVTVRTIFENPTVAQLAQQLDGARKARPSLRAMRRRPS
nr:amino acid adenylation domain-containing protein [Streptomyces tubercidicus]